MGKGFFDGNFSPQGRSRRWFIAGGTWILCLFVLFPFWAAGAQKEGVYHPVARGVTLYRISLAYKVSIAKLMAANGLSSPGELKEGQRLFIPGARALLPVKPAVPLTAAEKSALVGSLEREKDERPADPPFAGNGKDNQPPWKGRELDIIWPIQGRINSPFGPRGKKFHAGIDIASPFYQEVKAPMDGEVILARSTPAGYGKLVILRHDLGFTTIHGHLNVIIAQEGEAVRQGQAIGGVGSTGRSTGPHLHFEVRHDGRAINPLPLLPQTIEELLEKASKGR